MNYRKKLPEELTYEETAVWCCTQTDCKGWMRDDFAFEDEPACRLCGHSMTRGTRLLPLLQNGLIDSKLKKGISTATDRTE